jgi:hypothetical protein
MYNLVIQSLAKSTIDWDFSEHSAIVSPTECMSKTYIDRISGKILSKWKWSMWTADKHIFMNNWFTLIQWFLILPFIPMSQRGRLLGLDLWDEYEHSCNEKLLLRQLGKNLIFARRFCRKFFSNRKYTQPWWLLCNAFDGCCKSLLTFAIPLENSRQAVDCSLHTKNEISTTRQHYGTWEVIDDQWNGWRRNWSGRRRTLLLLSLNSGNSGGRCRWNGRRIGSAPEPFAWSSLLQLLCSDPCIMSCGTGLHWHLIRMI